MESNENIKIKIFRSMDDDWVPLHRIVRDFMKLNKLEPTRSEFLNTLEFIKVLIDEKEIICLEGPKMTEVKGTGKEITDWILKLYEKEGYHPISFGIWFDRKRE